MITRRRLCLLAATGGALGCGPAWAQGLGPGVEPPLRLEGRSLARRVHVGGVELLLNGAGVRAVAWFKAFVAGLYLVTPTRSAAEAITAPGPKRLQMQLLTDVPAAELGKALRRGVLRNSSAAEREALAVQVEALAGQIDGLGTLRKGDVLDLDWDPARGLVLLLNGKSLPTLRELADARQPALYAAVLRAFIGERPYDERLKAGLLSAAGAGIVAKPGPEPR
jgi:hypothetical protein